MQTWEAHRFDNAVIIWPSEKKPSKSTNSVIAGEKKWMIIEKDFQVKMQNHISTLPASHKNL